jgi:hypothetical protein
MFTRIKIKNYRFMKKVLNIHKQLEDTNRLCQNKNPEVDYLCCIHTILVFCVKSSLESKVVVKHDDLWQLW